MNQENYYKILEVSEDASIDVIKAAYRALTKKYHPDSFGGNNVSMERKMIQINEAYSILADEQKRKNYDLLLKSDNGMTGHNKTESNYSDNISEQDKRNKENIDNALLSSNMEYVWKEIAHGNIYAEYAMEKYFSRECAHAIDVGSVSELNKIASAVIKKKSEGNLVAKYIYEHLLYDMYIRDRRNVYNARQVAREILLLAENGVISAIVTKGFWGTHGYNNATSSKKAGIKYLELGVEKKHPTALAWLGSYYRTGEVIGVIDVVKARVYLELAAMYGQPYAIRELGKLNRGSTSVSTCFVTSAVCEQLGKQDDCEELTLFRWFRDEWLIHQPGGADLIQEYYEIAPDIVSEIDTRGDSAQIYRFILDEYLLVCISDIKTEKYDECKEVYIDLVNMLRKKYLDNRM